MMKIKVDPDLLEQRANDIQKCCLEMDDAISKLMSLMDDLQDSSFGTGYSWPSKRFMDSMHEFRDISQAFSIRGEEVSCALKQFAERVRSWPGSGGDWSDLLKPGIIWWE